MTKYEIAANIGLFLAEKVGTVFGTDDETLLYPVARLAVLAAEGPTVRFR